MSARTKKLYTVYYNDGTYLSYRLTKPEYDMIGKAVSDPNGPITAVDLSIGLLVTRDIRSVILQSEKPVEQNEGASPDMTPEEKSWVESARLAERIARQEASLDDDEYNTDTDYEGGMI